MNAESSHASYLSLDLDWLDNNEIYVWFHFSIKIQQAPPPNQLVLSVVFRKAERKGNIRRQKMLVKFKKDKHKDILDVTLVWFMHCNSKAA